ncbi:MAG: PaaX family transcriptional regulator [Actinomycetota bacterium]|nr:PaaX family transcriptional regulator [Actinomycetota bacterium]
MQNGQPDHGDSQGFVLTLLAIYGRSYGQPVWSGGLVRLLGEAGYSATAARATLNRLVGRGLLDRRRNGRLIHYDTTARCAELLAEGDRRILTLGNPDAWDGTWTAVVHTVPESRAQERNRLGRRLRFLGFRPVQDSIWLSPNTRDRDVHNLAVSIGILGQIAVIVGTSPSDLAADQLLERTWNLDALCTQYERFNMRFGPHVPAEPGAEPTIPIQSDQDAFLLRARAAHEFRRFAMLDPNVPEALLPRPTVRLDAAQTFHRVMSHLAQAGQRHFEATMSSRGG